MRVKLAVVLTLCLIVGGCIRDEVPPEIGTAIEVMIDGYMSNTRDGMHNASRKFHELDLKIAPIGNLRIRRACYRRCIERVVNIDPDKIEIQYRGWYLADAIHYGVFYIDALESCGASKEEAWDARFTLFSYARKHIGEMRAGIKLPDGVERRGSGFDVRDMQAFNRYTEMQDGYNHAYGEYEARVNMMEASSFRHDVRDLPEDVKTRMVKKFEAFLGRPMRTREQCEQDHRNRKAKLSMRTDASTPPTVRNDTTDMPHEVEVEFAR